jgi:hypothetical protein
MGSAVVAKPVSFATEFWLVVRPAVGKGECIEEFE